MIAFGEVLQVQFSNHFLRSTVKLDFRDFKNRDRRADDRARAERRNRGFKVHAMEEKMVNFFSWLFAQKSRARARAKMPKIEV